MLCGRQILWMMYHHFRTNRDLGKIYGIVDLAKIEWRGDKHIESFRNDWEMLVEGLPHRTERSVLAELLLEQMTKSTILKSKVDKYRKKHGSKKSYSKLIAILDRYLHEQTETANRHKLEQEQRRNVARMAAPARVPNCQYWLAGNCSNNV